MTIRTPQEKLNTTAVQRTPPFGITVKNFFANSIRTLVQTPSAGKVVLPGLLSGMILASCGKVETAVLATVDGGNGISQTTINTTKPSAQTHLGSSGEVKTLYRTVEKKIDSAKQEQEFLVDPSKVAFRDYLTAVAEPEHVDVIMKMLNGEGTKSGKREGVVFETKNGVIEAIYPIQLVLQKHSDSANSTTVFDRSGYVDIKQIPESGKITAHYLLPEVDQKGLEDAKYKTLTMEGTIGIMDPTASFGEKHSLLPKFVSGNKLDMGSVSAPLNKYHTPLFLLNPTQTETVKSYQSMDRALLEQYAKDKSVSVDHLKTSDLFGKKKLVFVLGVREVNFAYGAEYIFPLQSSKVLSPGKIPMNDVVLPGTTEIAKAREQLQKEGK